MSPRQIFFTHVMKTGGTSLSRALRSVVPSDRAYPNTDDGPDLAAKTFVHQLMDMDEAQRRSYQFISVHQPAWVAFAAAPHAHRITLLREPVSRTVSHLRQLSASPATPDDLEAIYDDDDWRRRLADYQTQLFADPGPEGEPEGAPLDAGSLGEDDLEEIRRGVVRFWETGLSHPREMGAADLDAAVDRLDAYDCVGVMEDIPGMVERVARLTGLDLPPAPHSNVGTQSHSVSAELLDRIRADNRHDLELYEHARRLATQPCPPG